MTNRQQTCHQMTVKEWIEQLPIPDNACLTSTRLYAGQYIVLYMPVNSQYVLLDKDTGIIKIPSQIKQEHLKQKWVRHLMPTYGE